MKEQFKSLQIIFVALLVGATMFALISNFIIVQPKFINFDFTDIMVIIGGAAGVIGILFSGIMYQQLSKVRLTDTSLQSKLNRYQSAKIIQWALLEGVALMNIVLMITNGNGIHLLFFILIIAVYITKVPSKNKFAMDFQLTEEEKNMI